MITLESAICPVCNNKQEFELDNSKFKERRGNIRRDILIIKKVNGDVFKCEIQVKCYKCYQTFKITKEIKLI